MQRRQLAEAAGLDEAAYAADAVDETSVLHDRMDTRGFARKSAQLARLFERGGHRLLAQHMATMGETDGHHRAPCRRNDDVEE